MLKKVLWKICNSLALLGFDLRTTVRSLRGLIPYFRDLQKFKRQIPNGNIEFPITRLAPYLQDRFAESGSAKGAYFHQDLHVARRIYLNTPEKHVDVGSRVDGFVAHVASFRMIEVFDFRPLENHVENIHFTQCDMMSPLESSLVDYCDSLSCLHALEHFGLGRYGDPVNYHGHLLGFNNLWKCLRKGGKLYFSAPIGSQRIEYNAHRIFSVEYLLNLFEGKFRLDQLSFVDDFGDLHEAVPFSPSDARNSFGCIAGCGIFEATKL